MPEKEKHFNWLRIKPFGLAIGLILSFSFSIFLTFTFPPSVAYAQTIISIYLLFLNQPYIYTHLGLGSNSEPDLAGYKLYIRKSFLKLR